MDADIAALVREKPCRYGRMKFLLTDLWIAQSLGWYAEYSERECELFRYFIKPGDTVVNAGGNIGAHAVYLSQLVGPHGKLYTFEPQGPLYELLRENLTANCPDNWKALCAALGPRSGEAVLPKLDYTIPRNLGGAHIFDGEIPVRMVSIDDLSIEPKFIHLDVEGAELLVLRGAQRTIAKHRPLLYLEFTEDSRDALMGELEKMNYNYTVHHPAMFNPDNYAGNKTNLFGITVSFNIFAFPK
jgi:FkbM family methyltransferase